MGYDMYYVNKPDGEDEKVEALRAQRLVLWKKFQNTPDEQRDGQDWDDLGNALDAKGIEIYNAEQSYFRLNIWGMGRFRGAMEQLGMIYWSTDGEPWPDVTDRTYQIMEAMRDETSISASVEEFGEALAAIKYERDRLAANIELETNPHAVIPSHKFGSNDGWIVTPTEINNALFEYGKTTQEQRDNALEHEDIDSAIWDKWIEYLRGAARHGGFKVH